MEVFVSGPSFKFSNLAVPDGSVVRDVLNRFVQQQGVPSGDLYVIRNGRRSGLDDPLQHGAVYHLEARLCGGKGGFGSMLRALGAQIEKTTNREACRDLSGRRLRDVNHEKEMAEWLKKQAEREVEKEQRRLERLQRKLSEPKHQFTDPEYQQQCHDLSERLEDSVIRGLQASSVGQVRVDDASPAKRPNSDRREQPHRKKRAAAGGCFWMGMDDLLSSEDEDDEESPSTSSSCGVTAVTVTAEMDEVEPGEISSSSLTPRTARPEEEGRRSAEGGRGLVEGCSSAEGGRGLVEEGQRTTEACRDRPDGLTEDPGAPKTSEGGALLDLSSLSSVHQLESLGLEVLKQDLMARGLKCGGTLKERAARLFSIRGLEPDQIDPALRARPAKTRR